MTTPTPPPVPANAPAVPPPQLWRTSNLLVIQAGAPFPDRCVKCSRPAAGGRKRLTIGWHEPWIYLLILVGVLVYVIVAVLLTKRAAVEVGYCAACRSRRRNMILLGVGILVAGIAAIVFGAVRENGALVGVGALGFLVGLIWAVVAAPILKPKKVDDYRNAWVGGVPPAFLEGLPEGPKP